MEFGFCHVTLEVKNRAEIKVRVEVFGVGLDSFLQRGLGTVVVSYVLQHHTSQGFKPGKRRIQARGGFGVTSCQVILIEIKPGLAGQKKGVGVVGLGSNLVDSLKPFFGMTSMN